MWTRASKFAIPLLAWLGLETAVVVTAQLEIVSRSTRCVFRSFLWPRQLCSNMALFVPVIDNSDLSPSVFDCLRSKEQIMATHSENLPRLRPNGRLCWRGQIPRKSNSRCALLESWHDSNHPCLHSHGSSYSKGQYLHPPNRRRL